MDNQIITLKSDSILDTFVIGTNIIEKPDFKDNKYKNSKSINKKDEDFYKYIKQYQSLIGKKGEEWVIKKEKEKLQDTEYKIMHISKIDDIAGYDILSYDLDGTELYIEVKTTDKNYNFFYLTQNEKITAEKLKENGKKYLIYRVTDILTNPTLSIIEDISTGFLIEPIVFKVRKIS